MMHGKWGCPTAECVAFQALFRLSVPDARGLRRTGASHLVPRLAFIPPFSDAAPALPCPGLRPLEPADLKAEQALPVPACSRHEAARYFPRRKRPLRRKRREGGSCHARHPRPAGPASCVHSAASPARRQAAPRRPPCQRGRRHCPCRQGRRGGARRLCAQWHEKPRLPPGALPEGSRGCRHMRLPCLQKAPSRGAPRKAEPAP